MDKARCPKKHGEHDDQRQQSRLSSLAGIYSVGINEHILQILLSFFFFWHIQGNIVQLIKSSYALFLNYSVFIPTESDYILYIGKNKTTKQLATPPPFLSFSEFTSIKQKTQKNVFDLCYSFLKLFLIAISVQLKTSPRCSNKFGYSGSACFLGPICESYL